MPTPERLAEQFEEHRPHVRTVAYRMLGSVNEAEDAVQEAWILEPHGCQGCRQPAGMADDGRGARVPGHAANTGVAPGGAPW